MSAIVRLGRFCFLYSLQYNIQVNEVLFQERKQVSEVVDVNLSKMTRVDKIYQQIIHTEKDMVLETIKGYIHSIRKFILVVRPTTL